MSNDGHKYKLEFNKLISNYNNYEPDRGPMGSHYWQLNTVQII